MKEEKSAKHLFEMNCEETKKIIEQRKNDKDSLISQIQFGRLARHCLNCKKCETETRKIGLLVSGKS